MGSDRINDMRGFTELFSDFYTQFHMGTFHFMVNCFANIMQQTGTFC